MDTDYKAIVIEALKRSGDVESALVKLGAAATIGTAAVEAMRKGTNIGDLEARAWAVAAARDAMDILGRSE